VLFYHPVVDTDKNLRSVEALIRWERAGHGLLLPDRFIPIAEGGELIIELDTWVLATAARQISAWSTDPQLAGLKVSVNVSARHLLSRRLPDHLRAVLADTGIDPRQLTIEITETMLIDDLGTVAAELDAVRQLGTQIAVDDFGTGYTSLAHLHHLPVDTVKIDRSFITSIDIAKDASLIRIITELAHKLGLVTVSEGVETDEQFHTLQELGADQIQGYLIARPMPPNKLRHWATSVHSRPPTDELPLQT
jgi:EAL domain-containing protein (putative c-di-GMP-specific phosphodiesterase class I)